jgi:uncharacterized protein (TIGR03086 family)
MLDLDRRALDATAGVLDGLDPVPRDAPTPCEGWTVADVLAHLVGNNRTHLAVLGADEVPESAHPGPVDLRRTGEAVLAAHARPGADEVPFPIGGQDRPARVALAVHFSDVLVHGWDLARALGRPHAIDEELAVAGERVVAAYPEVSWGPGAAFAVRLTPTAGARAVERLLALTGRDPDWQPSLPTRSHGG